MNAIVNTLFDRIGMEATDLARKEKRSTLLSRDVAYACRFLFPDPVFNSIDKFGNENVSKYNATFHPDNDGILP
jgi:histone H2B